MSYAEELKHEITGHTTAKLELKKIGGPNTHITKATTKQAGANRAIEALDT